ncbi:MAG: outer membrane protein transport protein [Alphaproteobacteria bacterium]|nr:outer membrane protein transport protein [Alphaproteobacteria bacterium]MBL6937951.1 outer membrane protein transport protein [Alphaproteobacteria bacterium]MBL7099224.1 outer membrane protein transport protein [Alphaproteobacteria bacterium]
MAAPAFAAGYGLKEHSADAMSAAYAGAAATDSDASYLAYNPAALAGVKETDFTLSSVVILPGSRGRYTTALTSAGTPTGGGANPSGYISGALVPAFSLRHRVSDHWAIGLLIDAPWGLRTDYKPGWAGRYYGMKSALLTIDATPTISWQPTDRIALGAGVQVEYAQATLTSAIDTGTLGTVSGIPGSVPGAQDSFARLSGKSWSFGFTAGAIVRLTDRVTAGVAYHSTVKHDLKGPLTFTLDSAGVGATIRAVTGAFTNTRAVAPLPMPDVLNFGLRDQLSNDWTAMIEADWLHWGRFRNLTITAANPAQPPDVTTANWGDTFFGSVGAEYHASSRWTFRGGVAYDQSPVPDATREARIPDSTRYWLSAGVRYRMTEQFDVNLTYSRLFSPTVKVALNPSIPGAALRGTLTGTTDFYVNCIGFQLTYKPD